MTLQARLDRIRDSFEKSASTEVLEIMHRATDTLRSSGILNDVAREGQPAPEFTPPKNLLLFASVSCFSLGFT